MSHFDFRVAQPCSGGESGRGRRTLIALPWSCDGLRRGDHDRFDGLRLREHRRRHRRRPRRDPRAVVAAKPAGGPIRGDHQCCIDSADAPPSRPPWPRWPRPSGRLPSPPSPQPRWIPPPRRPPSGCSAPPPRRPRLHSANRIRWSAPGTSPHGNPQPNSSPRLPTGTPCRRSRSRDPPRSASRHRRATSGSLRRGRSPTSECARSGAATHPGKPCRGRSQRAASNSTPIKRRLGRTRWRLPRAHSRSFASSGTRPVDAPAGQLGIGHAAHGRAGTRRRGLPQSNGLVPKAGRTSLRV